LRELKRKPAFCIEHHNPFWIRTKRLESATVGADVVYSGDEPSSHELLLKRFCLTNRDSRQEHKSHRCRCGNTENDTSIHGLSSWSVATQSFIRLPQCRSALSKLFTTVRVTP